MSKRGNLNLKGANTMKNPLILAGMMIALSAATPIFADDDDCYVPMSQWQSRDAAQIWAKSQGWDVRRIKIDDGCYEIEGYDQSGREIEVKIDPATFAVVEFEYEDDDDDGDYRRNNTNTAPAGPITPANPPSNGLFAPGSKPEVVTQ